LDVKINFEENNYLLLNDPYKHDTVEKIRQIIIKNRYVPYEITIKLKSVDINIQNKNDNIIVKTEKSVLGIKTRNVHRKTVRLKNKNISL